MVRISRPDLALFGALAIVMLVTRTHSLSNVMHLPDTSLASFFVGGFFLRRATAFAGLFLLAFAIDVTVIGWFGQSSFCFTPAYWMLVPAYGTMWLGVPVLRRGLWPLRSAPCRRIPLPRSDPAMPERVLRGPRRRAWDRGY